MSGEKYPHPPTDVLRAHVPYKGGMDRATALDRIGTVYSVAIRLRDAGAPSELIAAGLGVEPEAVPSLLEVAQRKLSALVSVTREEIR